MRIEALRRRIELLQDFCMPAACTQLGVSVDKQYVLASGEWKMSMVCACVL